MPGPNTCACVCFPSNLVLNLLFFLIEFHSQLPLYPSFTSLTARPPAVSTGQWVHVWTCVCSSEGPLGSEKRPWPLGLTPEKKPVSASECPVWPLSACVCVCMCVWESEWERTSERERAKEEERLSIWLHDLCTRMCFVYVCIYLFLFMLHVNTHICGGWGAGLWSDETEVTGIDHCCSSQAKTPPSLCVLKNPVCIQGEGGRKRQLKSMFDSPWRAAGSVWIYRSFLLLTDRNKMGYVRKQRMKRPKHRNVKMHIFPNFFS